MKTPALPAWAVLALAIGCAALPAVADDRPYDLLQIGQSYRTPMAMVEVFAESRGHTFRSRGYLPPGVPIRAHWKNERTRKLVSTTPHRVLCLVPLYDFKPGSPEAAAGFFGMSLEQNADARVYLVSHWPKRAGSMQEKEAWAAEYVPQFAALVEEANRQHPDARHPMRLIPRAEAFMALLRYADRIPGFVAPATAYNDGGHQSNTANYMFAAMEYAWVYGESPLGLPHEAQVTVKRRTEPLFRLTAQQALALQRLGYHHLAAHPLSGVTLPADTTAPPAPAGVMIDATHHAVTLTWPEVDDVGNGVFRYLIRRSDGKTFDNVVAHFADETVTSGEEYTYRVVAVDFSGNESPASKPVEVRVPVDRVAPKLAEARADQTAETVRLTFDEPVDAAAAIDASRYGIEGLTVRHARLADPRTVTLSTSPMEKGRRYTVTVTGIADTAPTPNVAASLAAEFSFTPPAWTTFDFDDWDGTEVDLEGAQVRITARGEGGFHSSRPFDRPAMAGIVRTVRGDFDIPLAITSQGQVAATTGLKPFQRNGNVKTGFIIAENLEQLGDGGFTAFYLDDSTRFRMVVHRDWLVTARVIGAGLSHGDPRDNRNGLNLPVWVRFVREANTLTGYYSLDGVEARQWVKLGSIKADRMPDTVQLAIFNMSGVADEHSTAMFDLRATGDEKSYTDVGDD